jgi:hypothetical protein
MAVALAGGSCCRVLIVRQFAKPGCFLNLKNRVYLQIQNQRLSEEAQGYNRRERTSEGGLI